jgi:hypothetical protein
MSDKKPTLEYATRTRRQERQQMWWALQLSLGIVLTAVGLLAAGGFLVGMVWDLWSRRH